MRRAPSRRFAPFAATLACAGAVGAAWAQPGAPVADARCESPGPLAALDPLGAAMRVQRVGEAVQFAVRPVDAKGCVVEAPVRWAASAGKISATGLLDTRKLAPDLVVTVTATSGELSATRQVRLLPPGSLEVLAPADPPLLDPPAEPRPGGLGVGVEAQAGEVAASGQSTRWALVGVAALMMLGGLIGLAMTLLSRRR